MPSAELPSGLKPTISLLRLALPIVFTRLGYLAFGLVDLIAVSYLAVDELPFQAAGAIIVGPPLAIGIGLLHAVSVLTSQAMGTGDKQKIRRCFRLGLVYASLYGGLCMALGLFPEVLLQALRFSPDVVQGATPIFRILAISLVFQILFIVPSNLLEAIGKSFRVTYFIWIANLLNLIFNIWFVGGGLGLEAMGALGSAWATLLVRSTACLLIFYWILFGPVGRELDLNLKSLFRRQTVSHKQFLVLGLGAAAAMGIENLSFTAMLVYAEWISAQALGAYNVAYTALGVLFMISMGIGTATSVEVGKAFGADQIQKARGLGFLGVKLNGFIMALIGVAFWIGSGPITYALVPDPDYVRLTQPLIAMGGLIMIFDGGQFILGVSLRATSDSAWPTIIYVASYGCFMLPLGYILALTFGFGLIGLFGAVLLASILCLSLAALRFHWRLRPST